jgi:hypothetical protein
MKILERYLIEHDGDHYRCQFGNEGCDTCVFQIQDGLNNDCLRIKTVTGATLRSHCNVLITHDRELKGTQYLTWVLDVPAPKKIIVSTQSLEEIDIINQLL